MAAAMTAPTPDQMRALADRLARRQATIGLDREAESALRSAADQLEAVADRLKEASDERENIRADFNHASAERALWRNRAENNRWYRIARDVEKAIDQHAFDDEDGNGFIPIDPLMDAMRSDAEGINRILTAGTAPQEDRDD